MKNTLKNLLALALAALMLVSLVACGDKASSIKKAFEKEGYEVETVNSDSTLVSILLAGLSEEQKNDLSKYELIYCHKGLVGDTALIIKFPNSGDLKNFLTVEKDGKKDTSAYDTAKEKGYIKGNCYLITLSDNCKNIFN